MSAPEAIVTRGLTKVYKLPVGSFSGFLSPATMSRRSHLLLLLFAAVGAAGTTAFLGAGVKWYPLHMILWWAGTLAALMIGYGFVTTAAGFFSPSRRVRALDGLNLTVYAGEVFGLLGPNGAGKTTAISLLLGLIWPSRGRAWIMGRPAGDLSAKRKIGYLPEESYLYKHLNAEETLRFYGRLFNLDSDVLSERVEELLDLVGFDKTARLRPLQTYSKGMARRIGLAQALINDPDVIVLDEPTSGLDPIGAIQMKDIILRLKSRGKTILMSSHLLADVEDVCDRVAILYRGKVAIEGRVDELLAVKDVFRLEARGITPETAGKLRSVIESDGGQVESVGYQRSRLENLFRDLVAQRRAEETAAAAPPPPAEATARR